MAPPDDPSPDDPPRYDTITFLSDYGWADEFVGVVHSVIRSIAPHAGIVDLNHEIPPHDVRAGALCLARSVQYLCPGIVVAVVDPGVGTDRRAVAVEVGGGQAVLVGPDNGLLAPAVALCDGADRAIELTNTDLHLPTVGATFDGRDVFGPVAGHLANGVDLAELGDPVDPAGLRPALVPITRLEDEGLVSEVLWVDRFGNVQLNVDPDEVAAWGDRVGVRSGGRTRTAVRAPSYGALATGEIGLVVDSYGLLSVALDRTSAAEQLDLGAGDEVVLVRLDGETELLPDGPGTTTVTTTGVELRRAAP